MQLHENLHIEFSSYQINRGLERYVAEFGGQRLLFGTGATEKSPGAARTYTPNGNFNGSDSFTFRVNDGSLNSSTATVSITITAVNDAPDTVADSAAASEDTALTILASALLANVTLPVHVVLGDQDGFGPADSLIEALPDATLTTLRGVDHFATPKNFGFIDAALEFLGAQPY